MSAASQYDDVPTWDDDVRPQPEPDPRTVRDKQTAGVPPNDSVAVPPGDQPTGADPNGQWPAIPGYDFLARLPGGGMGQVFKARHVALDRVIALKIIRKDRQAEFHAVRRFQREAKAGGRLSHPNIVAFYDADVAGDTHFLTMEFVEGIDLDRLVKRDGPLPLSEACNYIRQAALGLKHAHEQGLVHRDIKPSNLMLSAAGVVKILDMGLARLEPSDSTERASSELTQSGAVMGTPGYMAPEQARDPRTADGRADIYSLGCTFYFLLTRRLPFVHGSMTELLLKHQLAEPVAVEQLRAEVPAALAAVVRRMMAKRPEDRYQTAADVAAVLDWFGRKDGAPAPAQFPELAGSPRPLQAGDLVGDYRLESRLSEGPFADVWRARVPGGLGVPVALKILRSTVREPLGKAEWQALQMTSQLRHPYLLQVHRSWTDEAGRLVIVLELAEGSLRDLANAYRKANEPFPRRELVRYIKESAEALDYLHAEGGVIHRDIKPANILCLKGHAKVADLGLAAGRRLSDGSVAGTEPYMPREAWLGKATGANDQFSLAVTYAELRLGGPLRSEEDAKAIWIPVIGNKPDLSRLPQAECRVLQRALHLDPARRYATCLEMALVLERATAAEAGLAGWARRLFGLSGHPPSG